jgi:hypothetical protein
MNREKGFIKYFVIIGVILFVVFLSQKSNFLGEGKTFTFVNNATNQAQTYLTRGQEWLASNLMPKISEEVEKRGEMVKEGVENEKEKISENVSEKIKNYFSSVKDSVLNKKDNKDDSECVCDCPVCPAQNPDNQKWYTD